MLRLERRPILLPLPDGVLVNDKWIEAKKYYSNWCFENHPNRNFDNLMELNRELAKHYTSNSITVKPALEDQLRECGCTNLLSVEDIMAELDRNVHNS
jgi:hypothetical protein